MFLVPTIHSCSCYVHLYTLFPLAIEHEGQPTPKLCKAFGVRGRQTLSPGHHSKVRVSQVLSILMFQSLVGLTYKIRLSSYNFSNQDLQLIHESIFSPPDLLRLVIKISYQAADHLTQLESKTQMVYQSLKRLFFFGGQAQIILHLTPGLLGGIIFHQLDGFPLGKVMFHSVNLDIFQP